jgi:hypothetical protein
MHIKLHKGASRLGSWVFDLGLTVGAFASLDLAYVLS